MNPKQDPHVLVAMGSVAIGRKARHGARQDYSAESSCTPANGIIDDRKTSPRTFPILDAIASICVSEGRSQAVAVALQMNPRDRELRLTIAENTTVEEQTVQYLRRVWELLRTLSHQYAEYRHDWADSQKWDNYREDSPDTPVTQAITSTKIDILALIYPFTLRKNIKRIEKWWPKLFAFTKRFRAARREKKRDEYEEAFLKTIFFIRGVVAQLRKEFKTSGSITRDSWAQIELAMDGAVMEAKIILDHRYQCELWADEQKDTEQPFPLRRALEKLTSHHCHIRTLIGFTHSPRFRPAFSYDMYISQVPVDPPPPISLPTSAPEWCSAIRDICERHLPSSSTWESSESQKLQARFSSPGARQGVAHCECSLIAFLETHKGGAPPFSYIGVSKLPCYPCYAWIKAFNGLGGRQYYTKGTHGKWYWPWSMPTVPVLGDDVATALAKAYVEYQVGVGTLRPGSDSSDASCNGAGFARDENAELARVGMLDEGWEEFDAALEEREEGEAA